MLDLSQFQLNPKKQEDLEILFRTYGFVVKGSIIEAEDADRSTFLFHVAQGNISIEQIPRELERCFPKILYRRRAENQFPVVRKIEVIQVLQPQKGLYSYEILSKPTSQERAEDKKIIEKLPEVSLEKNQKTEEIAKEQPATPEPIVPEWKDIPPHDPEDWVPLEDSTHYQVDEVWSITAASRRGKLHAHKGSHREDSFAIGQEGKWTLLAVADGAGSCKYSRVGAALACQKALLHMQQCLKDYVLAEQDGEIPSQNDLLKIKSYLTTAILEAIQALKEEASKRQAKVEELSTTLLLVVHTLWQGKSVLASIQVGDGSIAIWQGNDSVTLLGSADTGTFASETKFITSRNIEQELGHRIFFSIKKDVLAVAAMSDGVCDDFFPAEQEMPALFLQVHDIVKGSTEPDKAMLQFLSYERRGSFDDRTMAILYRR
ncbi:PP2C family serine/threonine-protein phosphatase [Heliorestis convoluta]|uniref:Phosphatase 2C family protein n=1 Tax=Heliorestis convoluta TaxID=356322 RepID=A0A5Q2N2C5_9FIRM|nr:PP2C family serine/threonine-protein phosphatase [Heliorestis convoluta]QGG46490.1 phosphatase 2C family protein [Heliorestis convoluta]